MVNWRRVNNLPERKTAFLVKTCMERFNLKRGRYVNAWRLVDAEGNDLVQPWMNKRKEAIDLANNLGYRLVTEQ